MLRQALDWYVSDEKKQRYVHHECLATMQPHLVDVVLKSLQTREVLQDPRGKDAFRTVSTLIIEKDLTCFYCGKSLSHNGEPELPAEEDASDHRRCRVSFCQASNHNEFHCVDIWGLGGQVETYYFAYDDKRLAWLFYCSAQGVETRGTE